MIKWVEKAIKNFAIIGTNGPAHYQLVTKSNECVGSFTNVCNAGLIYGPINQYKDCGVKAVINQIFGLVVPVLSDETKLWYYSWLFNRSPFKDSFIIKDAGEVLRNEVQLVSTKTKTNMLMASCIALRYTWEATRIPPLWYDLCKAGVDENTAFVLAHTINHGYANYDNPDRLCEINSDGINNNHEVFGGNLICEVCINFINNNPIKLASKTYNEYIKNPEPESFGKVSTIFGGVEYFNTNKLTNVVKKCLLEKGVVFNKTGDHPFGGYEIVSGPYSNVVKGLVKHHNEILAGCIEEINNEQSMGD